MTGALLTFAIICLIGIVCYVTVFTTRYNAAKRRKSIREAVKVRESDPYRQMLERSRIEKYIGNGKK